MTCNEELIPVFTQLAVLSAAHARMDPRSEEWEELEKQIDDLYKVACQIYKRYHKND